MNLPATTDRRSTGRLTRAVASPWCSIPVVIVSTVLLASMGGAIVAAPVTLPALVVIARTRAAGVWTVAALIAALTASEVVWALTYVTIGETRPWIWLLPVVGGVGVGVWATRPRDQATPT